MTTTERIKQIQETLYQAALDLQQLDDVPASVSNSFEWEKAIEAVEEASLTLDDILETFEEFHRDC